MDPALKDITQNLKTAIEFEGDGHNFYMMAAGNTDDQKGKEVFEMLAREELEHRRFLRHQYQSFLETGYPDKGTTLPRHGSFKGDHPIFSTGIRERISQAHMEMSALSIGIQLELSSIQFYQREAEKHDGSRVGEFFRDLEQWEKEHYDALLRQQEALKQEYWSEGGFSPF
jgi:rubrerythrin